MLKGSMTPEDRAEVERLERDQAERDRRMPHIKLPPIALPTGQPLAKQSDERAKAHAAAKWKPDTVVKVREDGEHRYAVPLSKEEAQWLKQRLWPQENSPTRDRIVKKLDWVIETAEGDGL